MTIIRVPFYFINHLQTLLLYISIQLKQQESNNQVELAKAKNETTKLANLAKGLDIQASEKDSQQKIKSLQEEIEKLRAKNLKINQSKGSLVPLVEKLAHSKSPRTTARPTTTLGGRR